MAELVLIDDDPGFAELFSRLLAYDGHRVRHCAGMRDGVAGVLEKPPDLVVLDLMLPDGHGFECCRRLRHAWQGPLLMLTCMDGDDDQCAGFEAGADDYVVKTASPALIRARISALLRRWEQRRPDPGQRLHVGTCGYDSQRRRLADGERTLCLSAAAGELLGTLMRRSPAVMDRTELARLLYGSSDASSQRAVDQRVSRLRRQLADAGIGLVVQGVRGVGYALLADARR